MLERPIFLLELCLHEKILPHCRPVWHTSTNSGSTKNKSKFTFCSQMFVDPIAPMWMCSTKSMDQPRDPPIWWSISGGCPKFGGVEKNHPPCHQLDGKKNFVLFFPVLFLVVHAYPPISTTTPPLIGSAPPHATPHR